MKSKLAAKVVAGVTLAGALLVGMAAPAFADSVTIRKVDTTKFPQVVLSVLATGGSPTPADFHLRENGKIIEQLDVVPLSKTNVPIGIVLAIDVSGSMTQNGKLDQAKAAARQFVAQKLANDQIAIVTFSSEPHLVSDFTTDARKLTAAIDGLVADGETALFDGVRQAVGLFSAHPELQANVVLLTDGKDTVSTAKQDDAVSSALGAHATVFTVGLQGGDFDEGPIHSLANATGGQYQATADPRVLSSLYASVQRSLQSQYQITYRSPSSSRTLDIDVLAGSVSTKATATTGAVAQGITTRPQVVHHSAGFLGDKAKYAAGAVALVAGFLLAYGLILVVTRDESTLQAFLRPYEEAPDESDASGGVTMAETALMQRAVEVTARFAEDRGILPRLEQMLEQADLPLRAAEALLFYMAAVFVVTLLGVVVTRSLMPAAIICLVATLVPPASLSFLSARRRRLFTSQLPDTLQLLSGSLRAGYSLLQGVEAVAQEVDDPMGKELRRILAEARLGRVLEDSMTETAQRMGSGDFDWAVMAVRIQREVGGNLAELLSTVADTMISRERLRREVKALTAEGRISAIILGILPLGLGIMMFTISPSYMRVLFDTGMGKAMLGGSIVLALVGFWWMKKTIDIEL